MSSELAELVPTLRNLNRAEKLYVMQLLVSELAQEEEVAFFKSGAEYPVWSPYEAYEAANVMMKALADEETKEHA